jgi:hypothetical protein
MHDRRIVAELCSEEATVTTKEELSEHLNTMGMDEEDYVSLLKQLAFKDQPGIKLIVVELNMPRHRNLQPLSLPKWPSAQFAAFSELPAYMRDRTERQDIEDTIRDEGAALVIYKDSEYVVSPIYQTMIQ